MPPAAQIYKCQCSKCYEKPKKPVTKRTIEVHLSEDLRFLQSLPLNSDRSTGRAYVELCIDKTIKLLSQLNAGGPLPDTAADAEGSYLEGLEGMQLSLIGHFLLLTSFIILKWPMVMQITQISSLNTKLIQKILWSLVSAHFNVKSLGKMAHPCLLLHVARYY